MNKQDNKLAFSVLATLIAAIALIYTLIMYRNILFAVIGTSALFLLTAFFLTQNLIAFSSAKNKSLNAQIQNSVYDISSQLETMQNAQSQLGKATFLYTKQAAQTISMLENNYTESQAALYKNISTLSNTQNKTTKLMLKYDQTNTTKLITAIRDMRNHLNETMIQGFDQIQPNNDDMVAVLTEIVNYLKTQSGSMDQALGLQLNNVAHELQNISNSIQHVQITAPVQPVMTNVTPVETVMHNIAVNPTDNTAEIEEPIIEETTKNIVTDLTEEVIEEAIPNLEEVIEEATVTEEQSMEAMIEAEPVIEDLIPEIIEEEPAPAVPDKSPNDMLSPDEIAALFAAAEPTPKAEPKEEPFTPTFTVVGKSDEEDSMEEPEPLSTVGDITDNPNKQLSPDEIAALFAAAEPTPKAAEPEPITPISDDPNKQLSPDEIAALFSSLG